MIYNPMLGQKISNLRIYPNKNSNIEIHIDREDRNNMSLVTVCMTLNLGEDKSIIKRNPNCIVQKLLTKTWKYLNACQEDPQSHFMAIFPFQRVGTIPNLNSTIGLFTQ